MDDPKVNILIVDDKPDKLLALEAVLEDLGQNVVRAYSGREALRALLSRDFAVVLLDVNMPGMDGFETAQLIRQRRSSAQTPIIFVTAFGDETHSGRGYRLGAVDYIETPVNAEVLRTKVAVFVDLYRKTQQLQRQAEWQRRRAAQLQKLAAASLAINGAESVENMLQTVTETARDLIGAHQAITLFLLDPGADSRPPRTQSFACFSDKYADWRGERLELDLAATTVVARSHAATRMTEQELRDHADWDIISRMRIPPVRGGMLAAPLVGRTGATLGVIYLADRYEGHFTHDDEAILTQLAQMASVAVENSLFAAERDVNRIKDEFLSTISHELRTPLNAILGWTQLLRAGGVEEEVAHAVEVIERNARAQARLIEDLLDMSRVTSGKLRLATRPLNLASVVGAAVDAVRPLAEQKQVALRWQNAAGDDQFNGDPDRLQQVVWNLLNNAVKFTQPGGRVEVLLESAGDRFRLRVTDTGRGISPSFLPYVFDRFRQADSTSSRSHGGLGIGLTIVRHIVEGHGGTVHAESAGEGHGATFVVTLPAPAVSPDVADGSRPAPGGAAFGSGGDEAETQDLRHVRGLRVVVVDDEPDAREVICQILTRAGATPVPAGSVSEALATVPTCRPDVVVTDLAMPEEDGFDLLRSLQRLGDGGPDGSRLPVLALTAYAREEDHARCLAAGFQAHLSKPVDPSQLLAAIARAAGSSQAVATPEPSPLHASPPVHPASPAHPVTARPSLKLA